MRAVQTKREAPGGWRATQGEIPVTGMRKIYCAGFWLQGLFFRAVEAQGIEIGGSKS
jgi:hypothetical protein